MNIDLLKSEMQSVILPSLESENNLFDIEDDYAETTVITSKYDIIVEKKYNGKLSYLYLFPSSQEFFIKDENGGLHLLDKQLYNMFFSKVEDIRVSDYPVPGLYLRKTDYSNLMDYFTRLPSRWKDGLVYNQFNKRLLPDDELTYTKIKPILRTFSEKYEWMKTIALNYETIIDLIDYFGFENTKKFVEASLRRLEDDGIDILGCSGYIHNILEIITKKSNFKSFYDYIFFDSRRLGFCDIMSDFFVYWKDTLEMQKQLYGKIEEKYPTNLQVTHDQLSYITRLVKEERESDNFAKACKHYEYLEKKLDGFVFRLPKNPKELIAEGAKMSNCIASYVSKVANQHAIIIFMRPKNALDDSYIDIEVSPSIYGDLRIIQAKFPCNKTVSLNSVEDKAIRKWAAKFNISVENY